MGRIGALRATGLAVALILFGACEQDTGGRATESLGGKVEAGPIEVGTLKGEGTSAWQWERDLADELERDFPGAEVELTFAGSEARTALEQRWRAGNGPDADYFIFQGTDPKAREWANEGFLMNLEGVLNKPADSGRAWIDSFLPAAYDFMRNPEDGGLYGVPTEMTAIVVFYNAKMFDKLSLEAPRTWVEFLAVGEALKDEGIDPVAVAGGFAPYMAMWNDYLTQRLVGEQKAVDVLTGGEGSIKDDPGFLQALQAVQDMRNRDFFLEGFEGTDFTAAQLQFFQGKAGMILMGTWLTSQMADSIPKDFEIGLFAFPRLPQGQGEQSGLFGAANLLSVNATSDYPDLTIEYIRRFTEPSNQAERSKRFGIISPVRGIPSPPDLPGVSEILDRAGETLIPGYFNVLANPPLAEGYHGEIAKLFFGEQDAEETLDNIDRMLREVHG